MTKKVIYKKINKLDEIRKVFNLIRFLGRGELYFLYYAIYSEIKRRGLDV